MKPGTIFGLPELWMYGLRSTPPEAYVVVDEMHEVGFWRGGVTAWGHIAPSEHFEVIS